MQSPGKLYSLKGQPAATHGAGDELCPIPDPARRSRFTGREYSSAHEIILPEAACGRSKQDVWVLGC